MKKLLTILLLMFTVFAMAQTDKQKELEKRKAKLIEEIKLNERLLQNVKQKEKSVVNFIIQQNAKINLREQLIKTTERQARLLNDEIYKNQKQINKLNEDLEILKEDYAAMILKSYKSRSEQSQAMFLLSSNSFLQAYKRTQYMKQYAGYRKSQGDEIHEKTQELLALNTKLQAQKQEKEKLIAENEKDKLALLKEKEEQQKMANSIKKDMNKITAEIKKKQQETKAIDRQIDKIIKDAIAENNKRVAKETGTKVSESSKMALTPEGKIISTNFKSNKGNLPWPVQKGFVTLKFGAQPHPVQRTLIIESNGIEITTEPGAEAKAIFDGEVMFVQVATPINKIVYIQHGEYITIYQNLSTINVKKGDKIKSGQTIGKIHTNEFTNKTAMKFSISQNTTLLNPEAWLSNK